MNTTDATTAGRLWDALHQARSDRRTRTSTHVEDALFRFYLPMARRLAHDHAPDHPDPADMEQAAEVALAQAILAWKYNSPIGFDLFASSAINTQLGQLDRLVFQLPQQRLESGRPPPVLFDVEPIGLPMSRLSPSGSRVFPVPRGAG